MAATAVPTPRPMQIIPVRPPQIHAHGHARPDITAAEGFYFHTATEEGQTEGREAEADAYISCPVFRQCWKQDNNSGVEAFGELSAMGYRVSGFSALGKRVKVSKR